MSSLIEDSASRMFALSYAVLWFRLGLISVKGFRGISAFVRLNGKFLSQVVDQRTFCDCFVGYIV